MALHVYPGRRALTALLVLAGGPLALTHLGADSSAASTANLRAQEIHFEPLADRTVDGTMMPLLATATSGLKVRFAVVSGPAQVVGSQLMLTGPGEVVVRATQSGDATHTAATPVERAFRAMAPAGNENTAANAAPAASESSADSAPPTLPDVGTSETAPAPTPPPAAAETAPPVQNNAVPGAVSDLIPKALIDAANGRTGPAAANQIPAQLTVTLPGNVQMIFVRVPAGRATLGSPPSETGHQPTEQLHNYSEAQGFLMSATEVTQAQYEALTGQRPSYFRSDDWKSRPVEQIPWGDLARDSNGFFAHLNQALQSSGHANFAAALPTDDQWEYACRAGTQTSFNNRTDLSFPLNESTIREVATYGESETSNVATHSPNAWGLYDMHGNVAEWTREGSLRGGSYHDSPAFIRSASKQLGRAANTEPNREAGFRVVLLPGAPGLDTR